MEFQNQSLAIDKQLIPLPIIVDPEYRAEWRYGVTDDAYHGDTTAMSSTRLKHILKSPKTFLYEIQNKPRETEAMRLGILVHIAVLEPHRFNPVIMPDLGDMRSVKNREKRDAWLAEHAGRMTLDQETYDQVKGIQQSVLGHHDVPKLFQDAWFERVGYYRDRQTGIQCRIKPDVWNPHTEIMIDLKTTQECGTKEFERVIADRLYHMQAAFYQTGIFEITGKLPEYCVFIAAETKPPYEVAVYVCDPGMMTKGMELYERAMNLLKTCMDRNQWPGCQERLGIINLPAWALSQ